MFSQSPVESAHTTQHRAPFLRPWHRYACVHDRHFTIHEDNVKLQSTSTFAPVECAPDITGVFPTGSRAFQKKSIAIGFCDTFCESRFEWFEMCCHVREREGVCNLFETSAIGARCDLCEYLVSMIVHVNVQKARSSSASPPRPPPAATRPELMAPSAKVGASRYGYRRIRDMYATGPFSSRSDRRSLCGARGSLEGMDAPLSGQERPRITQGAILSKVTV